MVLSQYAEPAYALGLLARAGRARYLLKERIHDRGSSSAPSRRSPRRVGDRPQGRRGAGRGPFKATHSRLAQLTPRERELLAEIALGKSNSAIAESLVLTKRAVEKHVNSIFAKLDLTDSEDVSRRSRPR